MLIVDIFRQKEQEEKRKKEQNSSVRSEEEREEIFLQNQIQFVIDELKSQAMSSNWNSVRKIVLFYSDNVRVYKEVGQLSFVGEIFVTGGMKIPRVLDELTWKLFQEGYKITGQSPVNLANPTCKIVLELSTSSEVPSL